MSAPSFLRSFLRNWKTTGAIAPSSPHLANEMVQCAEVSSASHIVELGPGTGALTLAIATAKPKTSQYLGIEINPDFVETLEGQFPELTFANAAVQDFDFTSYLANRPPMDCVISGLPWAAFPESLQQAILDPIATHLPKGARFVTFAYGGPHLLKQGRNFRRLLEQRFHAVGTSPMVWANLPPAFVYVASH